MKYSITLLFALVLMWTSLAGASVSEVDVETSGTGTSLQEAINNALAEAISQVNGKSLTAKTELENIEISGVIGTLDAYLASDSYKNKVRTATQGIVSGYEIQDKFQNAEDLWEVSLLVKVGKFKKAKRSQRKRIAVLPFYASQQNFNIGGNNIPAGKLERQLNQELVNYLVQSRKFTILDRDYMKRTAGELKLTQSSQSPSEELARLGELMVADYVLVGSIERFNASLEQRKMRLSNKTINTASARTQINYRLIETATRQVVVSDSYKQKLGDQQLRDDQGKLTTSIVIDQMLVQASDNLSTAILAQIYPVAIISVNGDIAALSQGGKSLIVGDHYKVYKYGKQLFDPYTKEYLGREENYCCDLEITRVTAKQSYGQLSNYSASLEQGFQPKSYVLRNRMSADAAKEQSDKNNNNSDSDSDSSNNGNKNDNDW